MIDDRKTTSMIKSFKFHLLVILLLSLSFTACSNDQPGPESNTGSMSFSLNWQVPASTNNRAVSAPIDPCTTTGVSTINISITDTNGSILASSSFSCSDHYGVVYPIPAGSGYTTTATGLDLSGTALYQGMKSGLQIFAGYITYSGKIDMSYIGPDPGTNIAPVANAGPDQSVITGEIVTLDGSSSSDPDGDPLSHIWTLTSKPADSNAVLANETTVSPSFMTDIDGDYVIQLLVSDGSLNSVADTVTVTAAFNTPPIANAGPDQSVTTGETVILDGSTSSDPDGDPISYAWTMGDTPKNSNPVLANETTVSPSFTTDIDGEYFIQLVVSDGSLSSETDIVMVTAAANTAPVANAGPDQSVNTGAVVSLDGSDSMDLDGDPLSYTWTMTIRPMGSEAVLANESTETPSFMTDIDGEYVIQLVVSDGSLSSVADTVTVTVAPPICGYTDLPACTDSDSCNEFGGFWWSNNTCHNSQEPAKTVTAAGMVWMDRNLGATQVASSSTDPLAYGYLYQWGRPNDGHQLRTSATTSTLSTTDVPGHGLFITVGAEGAAWRDIPANDLLWDGVSGINNPCPSGFRLPTFTELVTLSLSWSQGGLLVRTAPLRLVLSGYREGSNGAYGGSGSGYYWSGTTTNSQTAGGTVSDARSLQVTESWQETRVDAQARGFSVRCLKD